MFLMLKISVAFAFQRVRGRSVFVPRHTVRATVTGWQFHSIIKIVVKERIFVVLREKQIDLFSENKILP